MIWSGISKAATVQTTERVPWRYSIDILSYRASDYYLVFTSLKSFKLNEVPCAQDRSMRSRSSSLLKRGAHATIMYNINIKFKLFLPSNQSMKVIIVMASKSDTLAKIVIQDVHQCPCGISYMPGATKWTKGRLARWRGDGPTYAK